MILYLPYVKPSGQLSGETPQEPGRSKHIRMPKVSYLPENYYFIFKNSP
jgi:hypothetical protein